MTQSQEVISLEHVRMSERIQSSEQVPANVASRDPPALLLTQNVLLGKFVSFYYQLIRLYSIGSQNLKKMFKKCRFRMRYRNEPSTRQFRGTK